jgi:hypothetical protein
MIIFGFRTTESTAAVGTFRCPRCQTTQGYRHLVYNRWFTLYFLPIIPLGRTGEQAECQGCFSRFLPDVLDTQVGGTALNAVIVDEFVPQPGAVPKPPLLPATSSLAITSLILGLLSPVLLCVFGLSLLTSLGAIIAGHIALRNIQRSAGELAGQGLAIMGLVLGYTLLVVTLVGWGLVGASFYQGWRNARQVAVEPWTPVPSADPTDTMTVPEKPLMTEGTDRVATGTEPQGETADSELIPPETAIPLPLPRFRPPRAVKMPRNGRAGRELSIVQQFPDMGWTVESLAFAPDGRFLAVGKLDAMLLLLEVATGKQVQAVSRLDELGQVTCVTFSFDGGKLFAGGYQGGIHVWEVSTAGRLESAGKLQGHTQAVTTLVASPGAPFIVSGSAAGELRWQVYDQSTPEVRSLAAFERRVLAVHLPQEGVEASATDGRRIVRFDLRESRILESRDLSGVAGAATAAFSPDGSQLATTIGSDSHIWDVRTGTRIATVASSPEIQWSIAFLPDRSAVVTGGHGRATVWSLPDGQPRASVDLGGVLYVKPLAVSSDGRLLAAVPSAAGQTLSVVQLTDEP